MTVATRTTELLAESVGLETAHELVAECDTLGIGVVGHTEAGYPARLRTLPDRPKVLFYRGTLGVASERRSVAVVGTREPTGWGRRAAHRIADRFVDEGWVVISGLALGVDTIAHECSLARHAATVAVLGSGLAAVYPPENRTLADRIVREGGVLLAEVTPHTPADERTLMMRDRLQSGLADLTVVCQAERTSGALHTARYAAEQGRPLYVAALSRGDEPVGPQDEGTQALLHVPAAQLPATLPTWRSAKAHTVTGTEPVALPLDEALLLALAIRA